MGEITTTQGRILPTELTLEVFDVKRTLLGAGKLAHNLQISTIIGGSMHGNYLERGQDRVELSMHNGSSFLEMRIHPYDGCSMSTM